MELIGRYFFTVYYDLFGHGWPALLIMNYLYLCLGKHKMQVCLIIGLFCISVYLYGYVSADWYNLGHVKRHVKKNVNSKKNNADFQMARNCEVL